MKFPHHCNDHPVQVWREERQVLAEYAHFYQGIFMASFRFFGRIMFVPFFGRTGDQWPPTLPADVDRPESAEQARIYSAIFAKYTITPDEELAGQSESFYLSFTHNIDSEASIFLNSRHVERTGRLFYVTSEQFARFSQELLEIEQHTLWANKYIGFSKIKHFQCMKFIMANIAPREERLWGERQVRRIFGMPEANLPVVTHQPELVAA